MANESLNQSTFSLCHNVASRKVTIKGVEKDVRVKFTIPIIRSEADPELAMKELVMRYGKQNCLYALMYGLSLHLNGQAINRVIKPESETKGRLAEMKISIACTHDQAGFMAAAMANKVNDFVKEFFENHPELVPTNEIGLDESVELLTEDEAKEIIQVRNAIKKGLGWDRSWRDE